MNTMQNAAPSDRTLAGSHYLTREVARQAVALAAPMITAAMVQERIVGSGFLYVVVMDPALPPGVAGFEEAILHEEAFGDRERWDADYAAFARAKARVSWSTGLDGSRVQHHHPHLLRAGDSLLEGAVALDGIVVSASGAFPWYDEVFAGTVALWLRALAKAAREADVARGALATTEGNEGRAAEPQR